LRDVRPYLLSTTTTMVIITPTPGGPFRRPEKSRRARRSDDVCAVEDLQGFLEGLDFRLPRFHPLVPGLALVHALGL